MMANDYQGDVKEFARIVPIPVIPRREQVRIGNPELIDRLDAYTAPRLVQYVDDTDGLWQQEWQAYARTIAICIGGTLWISAIVWGIKNPDKKLQISMAMRFAEN